LETDGRLLPAAEAPPGMVRIPGGDFLMGSDRHYAEERPQHRAHVSGFWMDATTVTNAQFAAFVAATDYVTIAERPLDHAMYPGAELRNYGDSALYS
jgi:formylglycine-generating enzyme required for sulfatase activity